MTTVTGASAKADLAWAEARDHLSVVERRSRRGFRTRMVSTVLVTTVFIALFVLAAMQAMLVQGQLELDRLASTRSALAAERVDLEVRVATLESPDRLADLARDLGMVRPPEVVFLEARSAVEAQEAPIAPSQAEILDEVAGE